MDKIWIAQVLSLKIIEILPALTLIVVGLLVEKKYVGRIAILTNAVALSTFFYKVQNLPSWVVLYINILTVVGVIALFSYAFGISSPKEFYWIAGLFSSIISGILLFWGVSLL